MRPWGLEGESDFLYHNRGDGTFEEVSVKAGVHDDIGYYGLGVMWVDYDDDGCPISSLPTIPSPIISITTITTEPSQTWEC